MPLRNEQVTVFGGTGYLGQHIVRRLGQSGYKVRVAVRHPRTDLVQNMDDAVEHMRADVSYYLKPFGTRSLIPHLEMKNHFFGKGGCSK